MANFADLWEAEPVDKFGGLHEDMSSRLRAANDAWKAKTGRELPLTSGARSTEEQIKLFGKRESNPNLVAKPGNSLHEKGMAADISPEVPAAFLDQYGLHRPFGSKDPVHVEINPKSSYVAKGPSVTVSGAPATTSFANLWEEVGDVPADYGKKSEKPAIKQMGEMTKRLGKEFIKPLSEISAEDWKEKSLLAPAIEYTASSLGIPGFTEADKKSAEEKLIKKGKGFVEGVSKFAQSPVETTKQALSSIAENPAGFAGEVVKSAIYDPEQFVAIPGAGKVVEKLSEGGSKAKAILGEKFNEAFPKMEQAKPAMAGVGAAKTEINPYAGKITGEETARGQYPTVKLSKVKEDASGVEQSTRADIANEVLGNSGQVRSGVLTGNENTLRQEYTEARSANPTPKSEILKRQIAEEQNALSRYAEKRIENSGASNNLPSDYERGQLMNDAIAGNEGLTGYLKTEKQKLYDEARNKVGDNPIQSESVSNLLQNKQFRAGLGLKGNEGVAKSAEQLIELAKTVGFEDKAGNILPPNSIAAWKAVREALNGEWTKDNASTIGKINRAIDKDIALAGGQDLYKKADNLFKAEKKIFESKGIKTLFGEVDPNGVQTATNFEAIPKKLNQMPVDQWKHIYDTYDEISKGRVRGADFDLEITPELVEYANAAKAEMRGALAREIYQAGAGKAGVWNQNSVNNILNARAKKIEHAFTPEEQRAFHTLNYAGHIMPGVHTYEGAALQAQRVNQFAEKLPAAGRIAGAMTRIPFAESAGAYLGEKAAKFTIGKSEQKQASKLQEEMMKNAQKGKTKLKDIGKE